nr:hypothetical protein [Candidatus Mycoplasma haematolamae]
MRNKGYKDGLVAEQCPQLGFGWGNWDVFGATANKKVCDKNWRDLLVEILNL